MTYILFIAFISNGFNKGFSVSEFKSKKACEIALAEANEYISVLKNSSKCIEVKP